MTNFIPIRYNPIWALLYIMVGVLCTVLFIFASVYLKDITLLFYCIVSLPPIYIGVILYKTPYAKITVNTITIFGLLGQVKHSYEYNSRNKPIYRKSRFYLEINGKEKKLKMNKWFVNSNDWERVIDFFNDDESQNIIKHLITD